MKRIATFLILTTLVTVLLHAAPSQITFQGTLKEGGVPVNSPPTKNMQFIFVDGDGGNQIPGTTIISVANVTVTNGLFAVQLPIDLAISWQQYSPYIRVLVQGQALSPDQPINANLYAIAAIPTGMIAMFATACPTGWSVFSGLQGKYPVGSDGTPNFTIGVSTGSIAHSGNTTETDAGTSHIVGTPGPPSGEYLEDVANQFTERASPHSHKILVGSTLPPSLPVVFCQKL